MANAQALLVEWAPIQERIRALDCAMWERATNLAHGLGAYRNVWHNAMLARDAGRPWSGVDYSLLRAAIRIDERRDRLRSMESRLWQRIHDRHYRAPVASASLRIDDGPHGMRDTCDEDYV